MPNGTSTRWEDIGAIPCDLIPFLRLMRGPGDSESTVASTTGTGRPALKERLRVLEERVEEMEQRLGTMEIRSMIQVKGSFYAQAAVALKRMHLDESRVESDKIKEENERIMAALHHLAANDSGATIPNHRTGELGDIELLEKDELNHRLDKNLKRLENRRKHEATLEVTIEQMASLTFDDLRAMFTEDDDCDIEEDTIQGFLEKKTREIMEAEVDRDEDHEMADAADQESDTDSDNEGVSEGDEE